MLQQNSESSRESPIHRLRNRCIAVTYGETPLVIYAIHCMMICIDWYVRVEGQKRGFHPGGVEVLL